MNRRKSLLFQLIVCLFITAMVFLAAVLNAYSFMDASVASEGENRTAIMSQIKGSLEYGLKYGKKLDNYYGIEEILEKAASRCQAEYVYILDTEENLLYGNKPESDDGIYEALSPINGAKGVEGYMGIGCNKDDMKAFARPYVRQIFTFAALEALAAIVLFIILFHFVYHDFREIRLKLIIMFTIIIVSLASVIPYYYILKNSYTALSEDVATRLLEQSADDIEKLLDSGVYYSDIGDTSEYYANLSDSSQQVSAIRLTENASGSGLTKTLPVDGEGSIMYLEAAISREYISKEVTTAVINTLVTTVTAIMIAIEILMFLLGLLVGKKRERMKFTDNAQALTIEAFGIVRGISFFFASFRFMAVAFMSIVLVQIYKPVYILGHQIPYEILLSLPMAGQVFVAMITSYVSGIVIHRIGWKKTTLIGIVLMMMGTLASSFAADPVPFIMAQMIIGTGLGFAKMGVDIYAVDVSSESDMSRYTSGSNAGIIVGFSCSAALGALVASIFGYRGAYIVMTILGAGVFLLIFFFGMNVAARAEKNDEPQENDIKQPEEHQSKVDIRFPTYILFVIIPYFFIMMFVDYYFPVYANSVGIPMDAIGYVMLIYGIVTAYVGTPLCPVLTKKASSKLLMPLIMLLLSLGLFLFAVRNNILMAVLLVALIGLVDGIMPSAQFMYVYGLPLAKRIGFSKALGIEGFFSNMIGAIAPIVFGVVMMYGNEGLGLVAIATGACAILFMLINGVRVKKKNLVASILILSLVSSLFISTSVRAEGTEKIRIAYCQAGSYYEFDYQLYRIGMALAENSELSSDAFANCKQGDDARTVWKAMSKGESPYYEFVGNGFIDLSSSDTMDVNAVLKNLNIDLVIAMGTTAALEIKNSTNVPFMNFTASDPVNSGITGGADYSGDSRAWAHVDAGLEKRSLSVMDDIFSPKKIGIVYSGDNPEAYIYSGARSLDEYASANGKDVVREYVSDDFGDSNEEYLEYKNNMIEAHKKLAESGIDAFVLTTSYLEPADFREALKPFVDKGIPVFSINSTEDVRFGALAAVEMIDYQNVGRFAADTLSKYRDGTDLKDLPQQYATAPFLVLNIDTLRKTGIKLPLDTMISASKIYGLYEG